MDHGAHRCVIVGVLARLRLANAARPRAAQRKVAPVSAELVSYELDDMTIALFEIEPVVGFQPAGVGDVAGRVRDAAGPAIEAAREMLEQAKRLAPDGVEVKFGVKVTGTATWLVAKAATEGNFEVTLSWRPGLPVSDPSAG